MDQILNAVVIGVVGVVTAFSGLIIAYFHKKTKQLEEKNKAKDKKIESLHNGFRDYVYKELVEIKNEVKDLKVDTKLVKSLVVENKVHYKGLEGKNK